MGKDFNQYEDMLCPRCGEVVCECCPSCSNKDYEIKQQAAEIETLKQQNAKLNNAWQEVINYVDIKDVEEVLKRIRNYCDKHI